MDDLNQQDKRIPFLIITSLVLICVGVIFVVNELTSEQIKTNKEKAALAVLNDVISNNYNNELFTDRIEISVPTSLNPTAKLTVFRAREDGKPVTAVLMPVITKGYNGNIHFIVAINFDGSLSGVKIIKHNETEGFGDQAHQDNSDWLTQFSSYSLEMPEEKWAVKQDEGEFDQLSGATITSRSIINIIYKTLEYYQDHKDQLYATQ